MSRTPRIIVLIAAVGFCCIFFLPGVRYRLSDDGQEKRETTVFSMGLPNSPWWSFEKAVINDYEFRYHSAVHLLSTSWLFLIVAIVLFVLWRKTVP